jgi:hypothetical protein
MTQWHRIDKGDGSDDIVSAERVHEVLVGHEGMSSGAADKLMDAAKENRQPICSTFADYEWRE